MLHTACSLLSSVPVLGTRWHAKNGGLSSVLPVGASTPSFRRNMSSLPPHTVLAMPALSPTMTTGNIATYKVKVGGKVQKKGRP
jgi:hypothetical protein